MWRVHSDRVRILSQRHYYDDDAALLARISKHLNKNADDDDAMTTMGVRKR
jgi:hypothetical protein